MARGWESKSVELQMDSAAARMANLAASAAQIANPSDVKRDSLMLTRTRVVHDLSTASNARYRLQLQEALAFLDSQLAEIV